MIVVVDDCPISGQILVNHLEARGFWALYQKYPESLIPLMLEGGMMPDAFFLDFEMPRMNGLELAYNLSWSIFAHVPIIFSSSIYVMGYPNLPKPISLKRLDELCATFL